MKKYSIILFAACLQSCAKSFYLKERTPPGFTSKSITIDSTYQYYIRELYSTQEGEKLKQQGNLSSFNDPRRKLIEVEYLFVSNQHSNVIYFSTVPDKYMRYYNDRSMGEHFVNVYELKNISFGKINADGDYYFTTKNDKKTEIDTWAVAFRKDKGSDYLLIKTISQKLRGTFENMIPVGDALEKELNFKRVREYSIVFRPRSNDETAYLVGNRMAVNTADKEHTLHLSFDNVIRIKKSSGTEVFFKQKRMPFKPEALFDK
jgi:hypothetical protein